MGNEELRVLANFGFPSFTSLSAGKLSTGTDGSNDYFRKTLLLFAAAFLAMFFAVIVSFFLTVRGAERTVVPQVVDKQLTETLIMLQERELYPIIQLKYTGNPADKGLVIQQDPEPGSFVKAGRRVILTISQGSILDKVENYVGKSLKEVRARLASLFSTLEPILVIREPITYVYDETEPGTVIAQNPSANTPISEPTELVLVVSRGQFDSLLRVPDLTGFTSEAAIGVLSELTLSFVFVEDDHTSPGPEIRVNSQSPLPDSEVAAGTKISLSYSRPDSWPQNHSYGLFEYMLPEYPVSVHLEVILREPEAGDLNLFTMPHPGGKISFPYILPEGSSIVVMVNNEEIYRFRIPEK